MISFCIQFSVFFSLYYSVLANDLSIFRFPGVSSGLLPRDDSILTLLTGGSLLNRSSGSDASIPSSATSSTPVAQIYSQFQNYCNLSENGAARNPFLSQFILTQNLNSAPQAVPQPPPPLATTNTPPDGFSNQMPNLTASLIRSRSGSLSRRASEPNLQRFAPLPPNSIPITTTNGSIAVDVSF